MILIIDNYDSFTYNLYQMIGAINYNVKVIKNDDLQLEEIIKLNPTSLVISPGPGRPKDAGISEDLIKYFSGVIPILGVCLGHQAICEVFGGDIIYAKELVHGKARQILIDNNNLLFEGLPNKINAGRYHSLCVDNKTLPKNLIVIASDEKNEIMGVKHKEHNVYGVQFHPESILTECNEKIIQNFCNIRKG